MSTLANSACFFLCVAIAACAHPEIAPLCACVFSFGGLALLWLAGAKLPRTVLFLGFVVVYGTRFFWLASPTYHGAMIVVFYGVITAFYALIAAIFAQSLYVRLPKRRYVLIGWQLLFEALMARLLCGFTIDQLGVQLGGSCYTAQCASVVGVLGLSGVVLGINIAAFNALEQRRMPYKAALSVCALFLFGIVQVKAVERRLDTQGRIPVALIQTALRPEEKKSLAAYPERHLSLGEQWQHIVRMVRKVPRGALIVFPEATVPFDAYAPLFDVALAEQFLREQLGAGEREFLAAKTFPYVQEMEGQLWATNGFFFKVIAEFCNSEVVAGLCDERAGASFSSALYFRPHEVIGQVYDKRILLPIAEAAPLPVIEKLALNYGIAGFFTAGTAQTTFRDGYTIVPNICYEEMLSHIIRFQKSDPRTLFVNLTNDAWYPNTTLPRRHFAHGVLRAIENGSPYVRSCNTGVTAALDCLGRTVARLEDSSGSSEWVREVLIASVPMYGYSTLYSFLGEGPLLFLAIFFAIVDLKYVRFLSKILRAIDQSRGVKGYLHNKSLAGNKRDA